MWQLNHDLCPRIMPHQSGPLFDPAANRFAALTRGTPACGLPEVLNSSLPRTSAGDPDPRDRGVLRAELTRESAWVRAHLSAIFRPEDDDDGMWLALTNLDEELVRIWGAAQPRGVVPVWPQELYGLAARDLPPGVCLLVTGDGTGVLRRGAREWPLAVEADLGGRRSSWANALDLTTSVALVRAAADARARWAGDLDVLDNAPWPDPADGLILRIRVLLRTSNAARAYQAAQHVFAVLRAPAVAAERAARRGERRALKTAGLLGRAYRGHVDPQLDLIRARVRAQADVHAGAHRPSR